MGIDPLLVLQVIDLELIGMARCYFVETATAGDIWTCDDNGRLVRQYFCLFVFLSCIFVSVIHSFVEPGIFGCKITMVNW